MLQLPFKPRVVADSIEEYSNDLTRLTTAFFPIPTCLLAELRTHRLLKWSDSDFSINANSDRAIPILKKIEHVENNPYTPIVTLANKGMSGLETDDDILITTITNEYTYGRENAIRSARRLAERGASKQYVNRLLMPFSFSEVVVTGDSTAWADFFRLRLAPDVEPNFRYIAALIHEAILESTPRTLEKGDWHIAFQDEFPDELKALPVKDRLQISGSYCARLSFDIDRDESLEKHKNRFNMCFEGGHVSVAEHQAAPAHFEANAPKYKSNCKNWILLRKFIEAGEFPEIPADFFRGF